MGLILFPPCFTTISGGLTLDRSTGNCQSSGICHRGRLLLTSALLLCLVRPLIMWLSPSCLLVVYALGRTHIDVSLSCLYSVPLCTHTVVLTLMSFSCLYGVPLVYARGRTHIDRAFTWCTIYVLHTHSVSSCLYGVPLCTHTVVLTLMSFSCLYGVPLVYARGRTHIDRALAWLRGVPFMFSTLICCRLVCMVYRCVRTRSYSHW